MVTWSRAGKQGVKQKAAFINFGLEAGYLSNQPPFIILESYINDNPAKLPEGAGNEHKSII